MTWNTGTPAGTDSIRDGDNSIREMKVDLQTALTTEGIFPGGAPSTPIFRWKPPTGTEAARPASDAALIGRIYINTTTGRIERDNGTTWDEVATKIPAGVTLPFAGTSIPGGWLYCNGQAVSRTTYSALFSAIGTAFGTGDGSTTFNVPDLRGRFIRGQNDSSGNDPDAAGRTASGTGGATGDNVGSYQADGNLAHTHNVSGVAGNTVNADGASGGFSNAFITVATTSSGGNEARPKNVNFKHIIKY